MPNLPVNRDPNYMKNMWETTKLITDYDQLPKTRIIQEVMHDYAPIHDFKNATELHEKIRNDEDYDDWSYGTEPTYGTRW